MASLVGVRAEGAMADVARRRIISFENIVDLTHTLTPEFPYIPVPGITFPFSKTAIATIEKHGVAANRWDIHEHIGTQIDAPSYFIAGGRSLDQIPSRISLRRSRSLTFASGLAATPTRPSQLTTSQHGRSPMDGCRTGPPSSWTQAGKQRSMTLRPSSIWMA
jgi:putative cyclase